ncbi:MAG: ribbon-helix-helix protein, CopG family [Tepidisphaeraceae bacterium]|jgi:hypothetical protein
MSSKLSVLRIQLDSKAKEKLDELCRRRGMTQIQMMSRIANWFSQQDEVIQTSVLHNLPEGVLAGLAKSRLKKAASSEKPGA